MRFWPRESLVKRDERWNYQLQLIYKFMTTKKYQLLKVTICKQAGELGRGRGRSGEMRGEENTVTHFCLTKNGNNEV